MKKKDLFVSVDALIDYLAKLPKAKAHVLNIPRYREMQCAYQKLEAWANANGGKISWELQPDSGYGSLRLEADDFTWYKKDRIGLAKLFLADNFEIYALKNGRVRIGLMFYRLTLPVKEEVEK